MGDTHTFIARVGSPEFAPRFHYVRRLQSQLDAGKIYRLVSVELGLILLAAGISKGHQLLSEPLAETDLLTSRWFLTTVVEFEGLFGLWLLAGLQPVRTRRLAITWFAMLAAIALLHIVQGKATCPRCFGRIPVNSIAVLCLDLAAVVLLWCFKPDGRFAQSIVGQRLRLTTIVCVFLAIGIPAAVAMARMGPNSFALRVEPGVVDFGTIVPATPSDTTIWLTNATAEPVEIAGVRTSCPCLEIDLGPSVIGPGERRAARVRFDLRGEFDFAGEVEVQLVGITTNGVAAFALVVRAEVQTAD